MARFCYYRSQKVFSDEIVCITISSDEEEQNQVPFNNIKEVMDPVKMRTKKSKRGKSCHSSPVYQDKENFESYDPQSSGVIDIYPSKSAEGRVHYKEKHKEEDEEEMDESDTEEEEYPPDDEEDKPFTINTDGHLQENFVLCDPQSSGVTNIYPLRLTTGRIHFREVHEEEINESDSEEEEYPPDDDEDKPFTINTGGHLQEMFELCDPQSSCGADIYSSNSAEGRVHYKEAHKEEDEEEMDESDTENEKYPSDDNKDINRNVTCCPLLCRSIRIGSFRIFPKSSDSFLKVHLTMDGISFVAPKVSVETNIVQVILKPCDITQICVHFGNLLPLLFIFTTLSFAENLRKILKMTPPDFYFFDPSSNDQVKKITLLVENINQEQQQFLRDTFLNEGKLIELDQKTANEILIKSTPNKHTWLQFKAI